MSTHRKLLISLLIASAIFLFFPMFLLQPLKNNAYAITYSITVINLPQTINANDQNDIELSVVAQMAKNSDYYLRAAFLHPDFPEDYFGFTNGYSGSDGKSFFKVTTDENASWSGKLKVRPDIGSPNFKGEGNYKFKLGYYPSSGSGLNWKYESTIFLSYTPPTPTPTILIISTPTPIPTLTPTDIPKAVYKINKSKDKNGNILSQVKIYIDDSYIHHLDDEIITFCDGCNCNGYANCGLGQHEIRLEKDNYESWFDTKTFSSGDSYEVSPILSLIEPTLISTNSPVPVLTLTSTPRPTSTPTKLPTPSLTPVLTEISSSSGEVLGELFSSGSGSLTSEPSPVVHENNSIKQNLFLYFFIGLGIIFIGGSVFLFFKNKSLGDL